MREASLPLGAVLVAEQKISPEQLRLALYEQQQQGGRLGEILLRLGFLTREILLGALQEQLAVTPANLSAITIDRQLLQRVPQSVARSCLAVPLQQQQDVIQVAMADPSDWQAQEMLLAHLPTGTRLQALLLPASDILDLISQHYLETDQLDQMLNVLEQQSQQTGHQLIIQLVDLLLEQAVQLRASDIHLEPEERFVRLRLRIDGQLQQVQILHRDQWPAIAQRLKVMASLPLTPVRHPQDGRLAVVVGGQNIDFRMSIMPTVWGDNIVIRILDPRQAVRPLAELGFLPTQITQLQQLIRKPAGLIISSGPTGSGKTTTLYALLQQLNYLNQNIVTLEDPVEYQLNFVRQTAINDAQGLDFAAGTRALLRQDPDIILIGEMRDHETAQIALRAAMIGQRVLSTMHTHNVFGILPRFADLGVTASMLAGHLTGLINQRLVRQLCGHCHHLRPATAQECRFLEKHGALATESTPTVGFANGCSHCRYTGYHGRTIVAEILPINTELDNLLSDGAGRQALQQAARGAGFVSIHQFAAAKMRLQQIDFTTISQTLDIQSSL